ncbi:MAG: methyltransferase domain-containing protein [Deltaproteobacteria bacterium]|nr:methyltransferase domain-containing protein [Deltaproteobacteria bacterium]
MNGGCRREFFDKEARGWDERYHENDEQEIRRLASRLDLRPGDRVLDLGTGNGVLLPSLLEKTKDGKKILAVDFSWNMICEAARTGAKDGICFINASVEALPFKDRTMDCVTCLGTFAHVCDKREAIGEMSRVLRRSGRLYIAHLMGKEKLAEHHRSAGGAVKNDVLPPDREMAAMMKRAGLKKVHIIDRPDLYLASARR